VSSLLLPLPPPRRYPSLGGDRGREGERFRRARAQLPAVSSSTDSSSRGIADSRGDSRSRTTDREWAGAWERVGRARPPFPDWARRGPRESRAPKSRWRPATGRHGLPLPPARVRGKKATRAARSLAANARAIKLTSAVYARARDPTFKRRHHRRRRPGRDLKHEMQTSLGRARPRDDD